eukprot:scaffold71_cov247-Pinguiococcus_pyrenoidosus.AAC.23
MSRAACCVDGASAFCVLRREKEPLARRPERSTHCCCERVPGPLTYRHRRGRVDGLTKLHGLFRLRLRLRAAGLLPVGLELPLHPRPLLPVLLKEREGKLWVGVQHDDSGVSLLPIREGRARRAREALLKNPSACLQVADKVHQIVGRRRRRRLDLRVRVALVDPVAPHDGRPRRHGSLVGLRLEDRPGALAGNHRQLEAAAQVLELGTVLPQELGYNSCALIVRPLQICHERRVRFLRHRAQLRNLEQLLLLCRGPRVVLDALVDLLVVRLRRSSSGPPRIVEGERWVAFLPSASPGALSRGASGSLPGFLPAARAPRPRRIDPRARAAVASQRFAPSRAGRSPRGSRCDASARRSR